MSGSKTKPRICRRFMGYNPFRLKSPRRSWDVFVIVNSLPKKPIERQKFIIDKINTKGRANLIAKTKQEFENSFPPLYLDLALDGVILFDRENYLKEKLARIKKLIENAGLVREKRPYGFNWRWRKKPLPNWKIDWTGVYGVVWCLLSAETCWGFLEWSQRAIWNNKK